MEDNKLKENIDKILNDADGVDWHSNGEAYESFDKYEASEKLYSLIQDVSVKFCDWNDTISYAESAMLLGKPVINYRDLFKYFINNIYKQ